MPHFLKRNHPTKSEQAAASYRGASGQAETIIFPKPPFARVGDIFRRARLNLGWSQENLAEKSILSVGTVRAAETGRRLFARSHKKLIDAINYARATNRPPELPLTLPFPERTASGILEDSRGTFELKARPERSPALEEHKAIGMKIITFEESTLLPAFPSEEECSGAPPSAICDGTLKVIRLGNEVRLMKHPNEGTVDRQFLTLAEVAATIGCTRRFLETRIEDGELKVFKPSARLVRIRKTELEKWIELYSFGGRAAGASAPAAQDTRY